MSEKEKFDEEAKKRIMKAESEKHGMIRKDSFAAEVQSKVDKEKNK